LRRSIGNELAEYFGFDLGVVFVKLLDDESALRLLCDHRELQDIGIGRVNGNILEEARNRGNP
jgi:hypothetical protein